MINLRLSVTFVFEPFTLFNFLFSRLQPKFSRQNKVAGGEEDGIRKQKLEVKSVGWVLDVHEPTVANAVLWNIKGIMLPIFIQIAFQGMTWESIWDSFVFICIARRLHFT